MPDESCRCCLNPSSNFFKLTTKSKFDGAEEKSYHEVLQEITRTIITSSEETKMPQSICRKCAKQLKNVYSFMQQTQNTYDYYRGRLVQEVEETKDFEQLQETLIEIPETKSNLDKDFQFAVMEDCSKPAVGTKNIDIFINTLEDLDDNVKVECQDEIPMNDNNLEGFLAEGDSDSCRCDVCRKVYRDERLLAIHKRFSHMPEDEKMSCPLCSYKASRLSTLKVHMRLIHDERGYKRPKDLRKHIRTKHKTTKMDKQQKRKEKPSKQKEEQRFLCAFCGQSYKWKKDLKGHQLTHTGELPYECDICHKAFKRSKELKAHRVVHSDEKPFQCSECSKSFKRSDQLKTHMVVHSDIRPYKCTECEKSFKYPCVLRTHMYMHTGQPAYTCNTCGEAFSLRRTLDDHCLKYGHVQ